MRSIVQRRLVFVGALAVALGSMRAEALEGGRPARAGDVLAQASVAVGTLVDRGGSFGANRCTGVLIGRDLVMTAAHCIRGDALAATVVFFDGSRAVPSPQAVAAVARYATPTAEIPGEYAGSLSELSLDTAVLRLRNPVRGRRPVSIARDLRPFPSRLRLAGSGLSGERSGSLRIATLRPVLITGSGLTIARATDALVCRGDSGGPVVADGRGGPVLWGVASAIITRTPPCGDLVVIAPAVPAL